LFGDRTIKKEKIKMHPSKARAIDVLQRIAEREENWRAERAERCRAFKNGELNSPPPEYDVTEYAAPERPIMHKVFETTRTAPSTTPPDDWREHIGGVVEMLGEETARSEAALAEKLRIEIRAEFSSMIDRLRGDLDETRVALAALRCDFTAERAQRLRSQLDHGGSAVDRRMN
jgi:hypothetical protein